MNAEQLTNKLAFSAAESGIKTFAGRILRAIKSKGLTLGKVLQIFAIAEKAVADIEAVVKSK